MKKNYYDVYGEVYTPPEGKEIVEFGEGSFDGKCKHCGNDLEPGTRQFAVVFERDIEETT